MTRPRLSSRSLLSHLQRPALKSYRRPTPLLTRPFSYPKEGVFQADSPRRDIPGFGPPPPQFQDQQQAPPKQYIPQQTQQPGPQYDPQGQYPPTPQQPRRFSYRPKWYNAILGLTAFSYGFYMTHQALSMLSPLPPGTEEDIEELEALFEELDSFTLVQQLRSATRHISGRGDVPVWKEYKAYNGIKDDGRRSERLTTGPLAGSAGVAAQRVFIDEDTGALHLFVNFGPGTCGWPDTVHGGAISTICDEALGRVAIRSFEGRTGVTANLEVNFKDKVQPGLWYVLVAAPLAPPDEETGKRKRVVNGVLCCASAVAPRLDEGSQIPPSLKKSAGDPTSGTMSLLDTHVHVTCRALFVAPKNVPLGPIPSEF